MAVRVFYDPHRVEQLRQQGINPRRQLTGGRPPERRVLEPGREAGAGLELVEECARLRAENRRLSDEVARLTAEAARRADSPRREERGSVKESGRGLVKELDDSAQRFALLELDP